MQEQPIPQNTFAAILEVRGEWAGNRVDDSPDETALYTLLAALVEAVEGGIERNLVPIVEPSLLWTVSEAGLTHATAVCAARMDEGNEIQTIQKIARALYWAATGIDTQESSNRDGPLPLSRWCKTVGPQFSNLIARCLGAGSHGGQIKSLAELGAEITKQWKGKRAAEFAGRSASKPSTSHCPPKPRRHGLAKVAEPFRRYGLTLPNGILLYGPPGCGKTYIARQLAEELGYFFVEIIPSEVASPYIHGSTLRIREAFDQAAEKTPAVVFIDEFEALVPVRAELGGHQQYKSEEVNEFLAHLDSCGEKIF